MNIERYMYNLIDALRKQFGARLIYVGLQGSYLRGEATADSDIDVMVVLDELNMSDLSAYRRLIESLENADKSCGFICGRADLANWNPLEIAQLVHTTKDYVGTLEDLVPAYNENDIRNFIKLSLNNLYHELCHRTVHSNDPQNPDALAQSYKSVFFILQNIYYLKHHHYFATKAALLAAANEGDRVVLQRAAALKAGEVYDFEDSFALLFTWCQTVLQTI